MASLIVFSFQIVGHFLFEQLLHQPLYAQTDDEAGDIAFSVQALIHVSRALYLTPLAFYRFMQPLPGARLSQIQSLFAVRLLRSNSYLHFSRKSTRRPSSADWYAA